MADFYETKADLIRYLHDELDYDVLIFESGLADIATAYAEAGQTNAKELIKRSLLFHTEKLVPHSASSTGG